MNIERELIIKDFSSLRGRIGTLGGTFDPVHKGHIQIARFAAEAHRLDSVIFIPNRSNPLKNDAPLVSDEDRLEILSLALSDDPSFYISRIELDREGPSYTVDTLRSIAGEVNSDTSLFFILGSDSLLSFHRWHKVREIFNYATVIPVARRDLPLERLDEIASTLPPEMLDEFRRNFVQKEFVDISSTELREQLKKAPPWPQAIPLPCLEYIKKYKLYSAL